jgi:hypothetical protein
MWLHIPSECLNCAPALECSASALKWRYRALARSATLRGKPLPLRSWQRVWKRVNWLKHLSGLTLPHSTLDAGAEQWIASCRATPASPTVSPESAEEPMTTDSLSIRLSAYSMKAGLVVSSERTSRGTLTGSSQPSSRHWSDWVAALRSEYGKRPTLARSTAESDCSSWPTATAENFDGGDPEKLLSRRERMAEKHGNNGFGLTLGQTAGFWATPQARDHMPAHTPERIAAMKAHGHGMRNLNDEAAHWPTPAARDHKGANSADHLDRSTGSCHLDQLPNFVEHRWSTPRASDGEKGGPNMSFGAGGIPLPTQAASFSRLDQATDAGPQSSETRRVLNPQFVEWLMGWPIGWTALEPVETGLSRWLLLSRGCLSTLCSPKPQAQDRLL